MNPMIKYAVGTAIAAAVASTGAHAQAIANNYDMTNYNKVSGAGYTSVFLSGSTAVDSGILNSLVNETIPVCATYTGPAGSAFAGQTISTLAVYYVDGDAQVNNDTKVSNSTYTNRIFTCLTNPTNTGQSSGTPAIIYKESNVGSANGVQPLINAAKGTTSTLEYMTPGSVSDSCNVVASDMNAGTAGKIWPYAEYYCSHTAVPTAGTGIPTMGVSDVEAQMLLTPAGEPISGTDVSNFLSSSPGYDTIWGVPVTKNLYYALQAAEGLQTKAGCSVNSDLPACAPSLSKTQVASLYAGLLYNTTQLGLTAPTNKSGTVDSNIYVCRRDKGSGTEGSFEAYFLGARCSNSDLQMVSENATRVWANPSTSTVEGCMDSFYTGGTNTAYYTSVSGNPVTKTFPGGEYAIGIMSTELKNTGKDDQFRMVAVDGVLPTLANTINGWYPYFSTDAIYTIVSGQDLFSNQSADAQDIANAVAAFFGNVGAISNSDGSYAQVWGTGGDLSPALLNAQSNKLPITTAEASAEPVNVWDKAQTGTVNNCDTPVLTPNQSNENSVPEEQILGTIDVNN